MENALNAAQALMGWACESQGAVDAPEEYEYFREIRLSRIIRCPAAHLVNTGAALHLVKNSDTYCSYIWLGSGFLSRYKLSFSTSYPDVNLGIVLAWTLPGCL